MATFDVKQTSRDDINESGCRVPSRLAKPQALLVSARRVIE